MNIKRLITQLKYGNKPLYIVKLGIETPEMYSLIAIVYHDDNELMEYIKYMENKGIYYNGAFVPAETIDEIPDYITCIKKAFGISDDFGLFATADDVTKIVQSHNKLLMKG